MSENILKELCNKVLSLFKQTESEEESAKNVACNRLRVVLMQDRTNLTPELLQRMRKELVELLSKYVEMDKDALELNFDQEGDQMALMLSIPVIRAKDEKEIEEALKAEDEAKAVEEDSETDESEEGSDDEESEDESEDEESDGNESEEENSEDSEDISQDEDNEEESRDENNDDDSSEEEIEIKE